jgi:glycosyltransferase involved in cell wall biosynthesis
MLRPGVALSLAMALERWAYRSAAFVVGVTEGICDRLVQQKGLQPSKVLFLPNGADTQLFSPRPPDGELAARLGLRGRKLFLFAGLHGHAQDLPTILDAAVQLGNRPDILIGFVGDGPVKQWALDEVQQRGLTNVFFDPPKPLEEMPRYWSLATAALVTLRDMPLFEGARPSKTFPPMASGVPVIFAGKGEMRDLLAGHQAGIVVPPEDGKALAAAIERLADDPSVASRLGENGRALVLERFSWQAIVTVWLAEYQTKLNGRTAAE